MLTDHNFRQKIHMDIQIKRLVFALFAVIAITGCANTKFKVKETDSRFSENKSPLFQSENNRISTKSVAGGFHLDSDGVYLNPFVSKDTHSKKVSLLGLDIINKTDYSTAYGGVNQLGLIKKVIFRFSNGDLLTLKVTEPDTQSSGVISYNSVALYASYDKWETGTIHLTKQQFQQLSTAKALSCKIIGTKRSVTYEEEDISPKFLVNINDFYNKYVK